MKKISKRALTLVLALVMTATVLPTNIFSTTAYAASFVKGDKLSYGSYPQSKVTDANILSQLNSAALGTDNTVTLSGGKYLKVNFSKYTPYYSTSPATFEYSYQDDNGYVVNTTYWFKFEPIVWRVLYSKTGELYLLSDKVLDSQAYNNADTDITWANSSLRKWLNSSFYNIAFSVSQKANIKNSYNVNPNNPDSYAKGGASTNDKIFLISYPDSLNSSYGFSSDPNFTDAKRRDTGTDYAKCMGLNTNIDETQFNGNCYWWLRTPGGNDAGASRVKFGGESDNYNIIAIDADYGVCPAFKLIVTVPANFKAVKASSTSIKVSWSAVAGATGYQVYRSTTSTGAPVLLKSITTASFTDTKLTKNKTYYYKVRAYKTISSKSVIGSFTSVKSAKPF
ncbi:MAG: DUF6273 domain-containing protein [Eubacteriales bacterium]